MSKQPRSNRVWPVLSSPPFLPVISVGAGMIGKKIGKRGKSAIAVEGKPLDAMALTAAYSVHSASRNCRTFVVSCPRCASSM
jgi:hypothetical protein